MSFANYAEKVLLDHIFGGPDYTRQAVLEMGLSTTAIDEDEPDLNITEPADGYSRQSFDNIEDNWTQAELQDPDHDEEITHQIAHKVLETDIVFPEATSDWGVITHFFLADTNNNIIAHGAFPSAHNIEAGDTLEIDASSLTITLD